ncbi:unnamed protein product [Eruca vesicaria subsp. sativa]|uniref:Uncharacterized protein n=1 Tax=Eruca vesicaria subsp. sativa TaxID=29727 RepID=A0ABC8LY28_ERUVS|nr:unnamed protein product [Eruca vesicaria subsp. sativa]
MSHTFSNFLAYPVHLSNYHALKQTRASEASCWRRRGRERQRIHKSIWQLRRKQILWKVEQTSLKWKSGNCRENISKCCKKYYSTTSLFKSNNNICNIQDGKDGDRVSQLRKRAMVLCYQLWCGEAEKYPDRRHSYVSGIFLSLLSVEEERRSSFSEEKVPTTIKKTKTVRTGSSRLANYENPRIIDVQNYRYQEIVPLNAGNVLGAEDNGPVQKWLSLICKTLSNRPGASGASGGYHTPSPITVPMAELDADFSGSTRQKNSTFFHRRSFQTPSCTRNDPSIPQPGRFSVCDRVFFTQRPSGFDPIFRGSSSHKERKNKYKIEDIDS